VDKLGLNMMAPQNQSPYETAFTVSIEAREGVTTGISAADRSRTCQVAIDPSMSRSDIVTPGHVFPLRARDGGVLVRTGQTEGSVDLARMAGLNPSGVICEIMKDDGTMARMPDLKKFASEHGLHIVTVADVIKWRLRNDRPVAGGVDGAAHPCAGPGI
jgi:3,4-dihydroxy 2-butanone 4-phosphate synthase/GTP cyclohydrolase II